MGNGDVEVYSVDTQTWLGAQEDYRNQPNIAKGVSVLLVTISLPLYRNWIDFPHNKI